jgi:MFS family permease
MSLYRRIAQFFRLPPELKVPSEVRRHFKRNFITNVLDGSIFLLGESFVSMNTIMPVFASTLTDSPLIIGLVPALLQAGWLMPQLLLAPYVKSLPRKLPFAKAMGLVERVPYLFLPVTAFLIPWISEDVAIWLFIGMVAFRGFASGMVALPWQEVMATVIPGSVRSRFFGLSRTLGQILGVVGSTLAGIILARIAYPQNYGVSFLVGAGFVWFSFYFFNRTREPEPAHIEGGDGAETALREKFDYSAYKEILVRDANFRNYLASRIIFQLGVMATGFLAVYGIRTFSLPDEQAAVFSGLIFVSGILGFSLFGAIGDRIGPRKVLLLSDIARAVVMILAYFSPNIWLFYLVFLLLGFSQSGGIIGDLILGMELSTEADRPIYLGLARSLPGVMVLIAPLVAGSLVEWVGYRTMFLISFSFSLISFFFLLRVKERPNPAQLDMDHD